jgi:hypothetical protein
VSAHGYEAYVQSAVCKHIRFPNQVIRRTAAEYEDQDRTGDLYDRGGRGLEISNISRTNKDLKAEKLPIHNKLVHIPLATINQMVSIGELPKRLASTGEPMCASCMYGQLTRKACRTKSGSNKIKPRQIEKPGDCVSMYQMVSPTTTKER